ncbi:MULTISPECIES: redox-sensitive transcriptional activator SoxR [unclassified Pseudovibrio]|uniref:redox-sensitive transcriptional activator SoxR n=1 Tax=unclassified Pseudovibrio TaxID=2627060 RepID=UPI0007AE3FE3|nr:MULTISPECIES: redox-sensitive transcriptional activator SoxR [unclassified Pseudovibrio]KZL13047.1 Redox-sensitive transcriptional activator SoxR [Pseudovibrio sp. Ad37]KZL26329.1 Redox-sensitive transcriptional activator SoxR [Pseudovibrio sp. WM33]
MQHSDVMTIGELADRTGLTTSAIRFYETKGIVTASRNSGGQRRFMRADIRRLSFALVAQEFGFTIKEISAQLGTLPPGRAPNKADWQRLSQQFKIHLNERIARMENLRAQLEGCMGCGCLSLDKCELYNAGDAASSYGRGPRFIYGDKSFKDEG